MFILLSLTSSFFLSRPDDDYEEEEEEEEKGEAIWVSPFFPKSPCRWVSFSLSSSSLPWFLDHLFYGGGWKEGEEGEMGAFFIFSTSHSAWLPLIFRLFFLNILLLGFWQMVRSNWGNWFSVINLRRLRK